MAVSKVPGRGRKFCNSCQNYVGVRSRVCPNCQAVFGSSLPIRREVPKVAPKFLMPKSPAPKVDDTEISEGTEVESETVSDDAQADTQAQTSGKSRLDRINRLKDELIRELKQSAPSFSATVVAEIVARVSTK